ncbi:hypothetical protein BATDEDRAFT_91587 [Batrachochytrium dendrobatidis JAM81]|uniref:UDENN domain-containing protein n=1 Tax=Batrachochytrium dendrobatidis (strain JAM81 / FGSC 10211) TaxID=684364 RepID=F4PAT5_BATDJ|nr:uncharacterized protein BATDEDRAFT_91587 [Batrachochytrium dendrobatidis JAM81]EGF77599.1 hypothetical protein BATDEDRAFT_91587 [Batrachochytrium dendrobatidis JAM81]|eukprot:XP_006681770.1 hypothetical protein BATDEDRAFT_91587 [Batrachochytrium dendrobatidis JAM81]
MCLPDGAHASEEEFIYFHLPPVPAWKKYPQSTLFGLACFRQINAEDLVNKTADVTRTKVQKAVVIIATQPILGSIRSKLGLVTQAFFAQRDFTKIEILDTLYENLDTSVKMPFADNTLYSGISLRELLFKFRHKTLQLILVFGQKVERLSAYQYGLISLFPELLRHLEDVGSPELDNVDIKIRPHRRSTLLSSTRSMDLLRQYHSEAHKAKMIQLGHPLKIFGKNSFFQPYIPLQQIDLIMSPETKSFLVGTSNSIFTHHRGCSLDAVAYADSGNLEFPNPQMAQLVSLTAADRKFMDGKYSIAPKLLKPLLATWTAEDDMTMNQQIEFEGSDEDIRSRFEVYLTQMLASVKYNHDTLPSTLEPGAKKLDYVSEYHMPFIKAWEASDSYHTWMSVVDKDALQMINPGHPFHGYSALGEISTHFSAKLSEFSRTISPVQNNLAKAISTASGTVTSSVTDAVTIMSDPAQQQNIQASANQLLGTFSAWYSQKRKDWIPNTATASGLSLEVKGEDTEEGYQLLEVDSQQSSPALAIKAHVLEDLTPESPELPILSKTSISAADHKDPSLHKGAMQNDKSDTAISSNQ